jgi:hypothetical protein
METTVSVSTDDHQWALETAVAIRERRFDAIDWDRVAEELHSLGISEESQLESRLAQLMYHLLKWDHQPERRTRSWERSIKDQRSRIMLLLKRQPSLKAYLRDTDALTSAYSDVLPLAVGEKLPDDVIDQFPDSCPYTLEQLLPEL